MKQTPGQMVHKEKIQQIYLLSNVLFEKNKKWLNTINEENYLKELVSKL